MTEIPVRLDHVTKRYGPTVAVDDLSFEIQPGAVTGFLGPNGAGKTTTLRMLLGLATPSAGIATIFGRQYADLDDPLGTVGAVLETATFHPWRTARQHLRIVAAAAGIDEARIGEVLRLGDLAGAGDRRGRGVRARPRRGRVLARVPPAARPRGRAARPPPSPRPRRARQRTRPGGHPL